MQAEEGQDGQDHNNKSDEVNDPVHGRLQSTNEIVGIKQPPNVLKVPWPFADAGVFKFLPDAEVGWGDVWLGAIITGLLFERRTFLIGLHIGK